MKKPLNYYGFAFENPEEIYDKDYLKTKKGKKEVKKHNKRCKKLQKEIKENGFDSSETWSLDNTIISFTLPRLKHFREDLFGYPGFLESQKEWEDILDTIIWSFEEHQDDYNKVPNRNESEDNYQAYWDRVNLGFANFGKYLTGLWS